MFLFCQDTPLICEYSLYSKIFPHMSVWTKGFHQHQFFFDYSCSYFAKQGKNHLLFVVIFSQSFPHLDNRYKKAHNRPFTVAQHAADMMIWMTPIYHSKGCGGNLSYTFIRILLMTSAGLSYPWFQCIPATKYLIWFLFIPPLPFYEVLRSKAASKM